MQSLKISIIIVILIGLHLSAFDYESKSKENNSNFSLGQIQIKGNPITLDNPFFPDSLSNSASITNLISSCNWSGIGGGANALVHIVEVYNGNLYIGGDFTIVGSSNNISGLAMWDGSSWSSVGGGIGANGRVYALKVINNNLYVGGAFQNAGGNNNADHIAIWDGTNWSSLGTGIPGNVNVNAIELINGLVYVGGTFDNAGGNPTADNIAAWNGSSWLSVGNGITVNAAVTTIDFFDNKLHVGGSFLNAGGNTNANRIAYLESGNWHPLGSGLNDNVQKIISFNGLLYVGGSFTNAGGIANADEIASWDGNSWNSLQGGSPFGSNVHDIEILGSDLYACSSVPPTQIGRWNGSSWEDLSNGLNNGVLDIKIDGSELYIGGSFLVSGGFRIAKCDLTPLPVEYLNFSGVSKENLNILSWSTASEPNNNHFIIERSSNATNFESIGVIQSQSLTNRNKYEFVDYSPIEGENYYRIKQVDFDNSYTYSKIISIYSEFQTVNFFPNPSSNFIEINDEEDVN